MAIFKEIRPGLGDGWGFQESRQEVVAVVVDKARQAWGRQKSVTLRRSYQRRFPQMVLTLLHWEDGGRAGLAMPFTLSSPFPCSRFGLPLTTHIMH